MLTNNRLVYRVQTYQPGDAKTNDELIRTLETYHSSDDVLELIKRFNALRKASDDAVVKLVNSLASARQGADEEAWKGVEASIEVLLR